MNHVYEESIRDALSTLQSLVASTAVLSCLLADGRLEIH